MTAKALLKYPFGSRAAIQEVAQSKWSIPVGIVLVLLTGIARNYDQMWWGETAMFFLGPLIFSFLSGTFLFGLLYFSFIHWKLEEPKPPMGRQYLSFMGLFWATAPIAWLYALPVERVLDSYAAAVCNLWLLGIVSLWRVLLMARVVSVIQGVVFWRSLLWVLLPVIIEVLILFIFGGAFAQKIAQGMGGMRNSPEEALQLRTFSNVFTFSIPAFVVVLVILLILPKRSGVKPFPPLSVWKAPVALLLFFSVGWFLIALPVQKEARLNHQLELAMEEDHRSALDILSNHTPADFLPTKRIPPDPYDYPVWEELPPILGVLQPSDAAWVRKLYLEYVEIALSHEWSRWDTNEVDHIVGNIRRLPGGEEWLDSHKEDLEKARDR